MIETCGSSRKGAPSRIIRCGRVVALVRAGAVLTNGKLHERPDDLAALTHPSAADYRSTPVNNTIDKIAWIHLDNGKILSTRSRGKNAYYIPGGKREPGETDLDTLIREIDEELSITIIPATATHVGTYQAQAHGHADGVIVRMTCYTADHLGVPTPSSEIEEITWLTYADRGRVSPVDQIIFDHLRQTGRLH